jgi:hypothetical protein
MGIISACRLSPASTPKKNVTTITVKGFGQTKKNKLPEKFHNLKYGW